MKQKTPFLMLMVLATAACLWASKLDGQSSEPDAALAALAVQAQAQQKILLENQTRIEQQLDKVSEEIRLARIFASRGGKSNP